MASTFVSITTSAYTCVEFMLVCPSNLPTVYKSLPAASVSTANVCSLVWKLTFFVISASAVIFLRYLLHTPNIVSSNTFWLGLHPFRSVMLAAAAYNLKRDIRLFLCLFKWVIRRFMTEGQWSVITYNAFTCAHVRSF